MRRSNATASCLVAITGLLCFGGSNIRAEGALGAPVACVPGRTCFVQQYADMAAGPAMRDPFCGRKTYDGHRGTDVRLPSMSDIEANVPVLAIADGTVRRTHDGEPDRPVLKKSEWAGYKGRHCGNGVIVDHVDGITAWYCHLRKGSVRVKPGEPVTKGQSIAAIGASGMAAFPHLHLTVMKDGRKIDPFTSVAVGGGCRPDRRSDTLWDEAALRFFEKADRHLMAIGLSAAPPDFDRLMLDGPPRTARPSDRTMVGWGWFLNLKSGDRIALDIEDPDGDTVSDVTSPPLSGHEAVYLQYVKLRHRPAPGLWTLSVALKRGERTLEEWTELIRIARDETQER